MRVIFAIPALDGKIHTQCALSLITVERILTLEGISHDIFCISSCPYLPTARNILAAMFMADKEATDLFFIDADLGFDAGAVLKVLERPEPVVAGIYPLKRDALGFPVKLRTEEGVPLGRDGLIEAELLPVGFGRIKRQVFELLEKSYPELRYAESVVEVVGEGRNLKEMYDFFGMGVNGQRFTTEDYAFCQRWREIGGTLWVYPDIDFEHIGLKTYASNYHEYLLRLPGGAKDLTRFAHLIEIPGWMNLEELAWLAEQASKHERIVEIGSYLGRSTRALAENTLGTVFAVDDWKGLREVNWPSSDDLYEKFCANVKDLIAIAKVIPYRVNHRDIPPFVFPPDMVFIDGDHSYDSVTRDVRIWSERLAAGGLLCGHDYDRREVRKAVDEFLTDAKSVPETSIWYWQSLVKEENDVGIPQEVT